MYAERNPCMMDEKGGGTNQDSGYLCQESSGVKALLATAHVSRISSG